MQNQKDEARISSNPIIIAGFTNPLRVLLSSKRAHYPEIWENAASRGQLTGREWTIKCKPISASK
jgi:hypothetical protein